MALEGYGNGVSIAMTPGEFELGWLDEDAEMGDMIL